LSAIVLALLQPWLLDYLNFNDPRSLLSGKVFPMFVPINLHQETDNSQGVVNPWGRREAIAQAEIKKNGLIYVKRDLLAAIEDAARHLYFHWPASSAAGPAATKAPLCHAIRVMW
jgi:hypothetical protein